MSSTEIADDGPELLTDDALDAYRRDRLRRERLRADPSSAYGRIVACLDRLGGRTDDYTCYEVISESERAELERRYAESPEYLVESCMMAISNWDLFMSEVEEAVDRSPDGTALISLVFCHPTSVIFRDLKNTFAYLNLRSGAAWDLHFVGYEAVARNVPPQVLGVPLWRFNNAEFLTMAATVEKLHATAASDSPTACEPWQYSGTADLVSFMAYGHLGGFIDWSSLHAVSLLDANGAYTDRSLGSVVEIMTDWRDDNPRLKDYAPGELRTVTSSVLNLRSTLLSVGTLLAGGITTNAAYDLLKQLVT